MREILFKGKHFKTGEWILGTPYFMPSGAILMLRYADDIKTVKDDEGEKIYDVMFNCFEIIPETLCQYTGLNDKDGHRIWENDIVLASYYKWKSKVIWDKKDARFICHTNDKDIKIVYVAMVDKDNLSALKVIGNIFENPELVKDGDETENRS